MEVSMTQGRNDGRRFALHSERVNGSEHIRVAGEMDLAVIGLVGREMERAAASDANRIVLDLRELEFLDAAGIRLLVHLSARSRDGQGRLRINGSGAPQVQRVLELTGVRNLLPLED
jgi:anti-anti-sigma factor